MTFYHPKYYKKLRKQYRDSQVVNQVKLSSQSQAASERATGPGHKQCDSQVVNQVKLSSQSQASSAKHQASSAKLLKHQATSVKPQATSSKRQAWSSKLQAGSYKLPDPRTREQEIISSLKKFRGPLTKGLDKDVSIDLMLHVKRNLMGWKFNFIPCGALKF